MVVRLNRLSAKTVAAAKGPSLIADGGGLYLRVSATARQILGVHSSRRIEEKRDRLGQSLCASGPELVLDVDLSPCLPRTSPLRQVAKIMNSRASAATPSRLRSWANEISHLGEWQSRVMAARQLAARWEEVIEMSA